MKTSVAAGASLLIGAAVTALLFLILDDDEPARAPTVSPSGNSLMECSRVIPEEVFSNLGWGETAPPAREHVGRCERHDDRSGFVNVGTRAVVAKEVDRAAALRTEYDALCGELLDTAPVMEMEPSWLPADHIACAGLPEHDLGLAKVFVLLDDDLVQISLAAMEPTPPSRIRTALSDLVAAADAVY